MKNDIYTHNHEEAAMNTRSHKEERVLEKFDTFRTYFRQEEQGKAAD